MTTPPWWAAKKQIELNRAYCAPGFGFGFGLGFGFGFGFGFGGGDAYMDTSLAKIRQEFGIEIV